MLFPGKAKMKILNKAKSEIPLQLSPMNSPGVPVILSVLSPVISVAYPKHPKIILLKAIVLSIIILSTHCIG